MNITIDPNFSVYSLVTRVKKRKTAEVHHRRTMNIISNEIENATLRDGAESRIFAGFQNMSRFLPQMERYAQLAPKAEGVYVFGVPDVQVPPIDNLHYIELSPNDRLAQEWFILSYGKDFFSALATEELSHIEDDDGERIFEGVWTFDASLTSILETWLTRVVDAKPMMIIEAQLNQNMQKRYIHSILQRLQRRMETEPTTLAHQRIHEEVAAIIEADVKPMATL